MTREPDRFEERALEIFERYEGEIDHDYMADVAAALRAVEAETLERAAQVAKQSQEDCFCKDQSDEKLGGMPCAACMEAARIEGTLHGLADRALASPAAAPAAEEASCSSDMTSDGYFYRCRLPQGHVGPHKEWDTAEWTDAEHHDGAPPSEPVAPSALMEVLREALSDLDFPPYYAHRIRAALTTSPAAQGKEPRK